MINIRKQQSPSLLVFLNLVLLVVLLSVTGCGKKKGAELYHIFPDKTWARFNLLSFEIPIENMERGDVYLFARFDPGFLYESLDFNMIMNTPAGEERINEYQMAVKAKTGEFCIECTKDSCQGSILLKKEINLSKPGILKVEIENMIPRIATEGILGIGIRVVPSGK
jgi:gliding motility-associated lipoprotein GldH